MLQLHNTCIGNAAMQKMHGLHVSFLGDLHFSCAIWPQCLAMRVSDAT